MITSSFPSNIDFQKDIQALTELVGGDPITGLILDAGLDFIKALEEERKKAENRERWKFVRIEGIEGIE